MNVGYFIPNVTVADVRAARPTTIFYSAKTCWWTHDARDLYKHPDSELPCDPRGGVLFETSNVDDFLKAAEANAPHYGAHGLRAFEAAHHRNCVISATDQRPTCFASWDDYNRIFDDAAARGIS